MEAVLFFGAIWMAVNVAFLWPFAVVVHRRFWGHWHPLGVLHWYFGCPSRPRQ